MENFHERRGIYGAPKKEKEDIEPIHKTLVVIGVTWIIMLTILCFVVRQTNLSQNKQQATATSQVK